MRFILSALILNAAGLCAALLDAPAEKSSLVVYNAGIGLVHEEKRVALKEGKSALIYPGVATSVITDSVNVQLPTGVTLFSQQYRFDKVTLGKIAEAHVGSAVRFLYGPKEERTIKEGTLLAANPPVIKTEAGVIGGVGVGELIFDAVPKTLIVKPSLVWNLEAAEEVNGALKLDYLVSGIGWKSDYVLDLQEQSGDLAGWITVDNRSGKRYEAVRLSVLAGEINRAVMPRRYADAVMEKSGASPQVAHAAAEGYHLYTIPFAVTLSDNEKTQIKYIDEKAHPLARLYDATMQHPLGTDAEQKIPVSQYVELSAFETPLPGGIMRSYTRSGETTVLVGESRIENTPKGEKVKLRLGTNFDLVAKNTLARRSDDGYYYRVTVDYSLTNRSEKSKTVRLLVPGVADSPDMTQITSQEPYTHIDGRTIAFDITLKAGESKHWQATYRIKKQR